MAAATPVRAEVERPDGGRTSGERSGGERSSEGRESRGGWGEAPGGGPSGGTASGGTSSAGSGIGSQGGSASGGSAVGDGARGTREILGFAPVTGRGGGMSEQDLVRDAVTSGIIVPFDRVIPTVDKAVPGDVLDARLRSRGPGGWSYEVLVLSKTGNLRSVLVDAVRNVVIEVRRR